MDKEELKQAADKYVEIPFGAKDSELCGFEYTIPKGMEAEIRDGKVIIRQKESEDERIRKEMISFIEAEACDSPISKGWISWLEKQKDEAQRQYNLGVQAGREEALYEIEKQKENQKYANSISSNCVSDAKWANKALTDAIVALADDVDYTRDEPLKYKKEIEALKRLREEFGKQKELVKEGTSKNEMGTMLYDAGFEDGKAEALKDLPRWKKAKKYIKLDPDDYVFTLDDNGKCAPYWDVEIEEGQYYITESDLEKLPKED